MIDQIVGMVPYLFLLWLLCEAAYELVRVFLPVATRTLYGVDNTPH